MTEDNNSPEPPIEGELVHVTDPVTEPVPVQVPEGDYTQAGVPTFDYVRDRLERRIATADGAQELARETPEGRSVDEQFAERDKAAKAKLDEIRRSMRGE